MLAALPKLTNLNFQGLRELIILGEDGIENTQPHQLRRDEALASHLAESFQQDPLPRSMDLTVYATRSEVAAGLLELLAFLRRCWTQGVELKLSYPKFGLLREPEIYGSIRRLKRDLMDPENVCVEIRDGDGFRLV